MAPRRRDPAQGDLLSWSPPEVALGYGADVAGRGPLGNRIARLVSRALRDARDEAGLDRSAIARRMGEFLERPVTVTTLEKWASEAATENRIPLDAFAALIHATEQFNLLGFVPEIFGFVVVPEKYSAIVELHLVEEHEAEVARRKAALQAKLRGGR